MNLGDILGSYGKLFVLAGDYLMATQNKIRSVPKDGGGSPFLNALTDADLSVQNLFEMATLTHYPEFAFDSEESDRSINKKYFPKDAEYRIILDPVDGTKNFKDGGKNFGIVMTLVKGREIMAVIMYLPAYRKFFYAEKGGKTRLRKVLTSFSALADVPISTLSLSRSGVIRTDHAPKDIIGKIDKAIEVKEITRDYDPKTWRWPKFGILTGEIDGFVKFDAAIEDWGAVAFLAEHAGASVSDAEGKTIPNYFDFCDRKIPSLVVSRDPVLHTIVLNSLKS